MRRVVLTGLGLVTPLGVGVEHVWKRLLAGHSGLRAIDSFPASDLACQVAGLVPRGQGAGCLDADSIVPPKEQRRIDTFIIYALAAAGEALRDAGWAPSTPEDQERTGVSIGSGIGGLPEIDKTSQVLAESGPRRVSPFFIPAALINLASGHVSIRYGLKGPNHAVVTACATGAHAIGDAARMIQWGDADVMVAGGAEAAVCRIGIAGFAALRALSTRFNDQPEKASRPWDKDRDGFVMGEGAGVVVLESLDHALARGARIYAEVAGYGMSGDAWHVTSPSDTGDGAFRAMQAALKRAGLRPDQIDYVNAHGTSTPPGDIVEVKAMKRLFQEHLAKVSVSSTKSSTGHLLGAAGSVEAIFSALAIRDQMVPPTLNLDQPEEECAGMDLVPHQARARSVQVVMSNSFGFGGTNASLVLTRYTPGQGRS